jgi:hypothetical protein
MNIKAAVLIIITVIFAYQKSSVAQQPKKMDMNQTLSDGAQKFTIAFSGLAFLSGEEESYTFLPPGKLADYFGFQFLRDNDPDQMGHNTDFVTKSANNMLLYLTHEQKDEIIALAKTQVALINEYGYKRLPLIRAFRRLLDKNMPAGCNELDSTQVKNYSAEIFEIDGIIAYQRAKLFGSIIRSLSQAQKDSLNKLKAVGMLDWPMLPDQIDKKTLTHEEHVATMTYASEMFGWYCGSEEADVYFCPERQATYFGGFYMKDIPAMGNPNYTIDSNITADKGRDFLDALDNSQQKLITDILAIQWPDLNSIVETRTQISRVLRNFWTSETIDSLAVIQLSRKYGELDGMLAYYYASRFAQVGWTLTETQKNELHILRDLDEYPATKPFLFSDKIDWPDMVNTDFLFKSATTGTSFIETNYGFSIFPNPFSNRLNFRFEKEIPNQIEIYNLQGRLIQSFCPTETIVSWNATDWSGTRISNGMFIVQFNYGTKRYAVKINHFSE